MEIATVSTLTRVVLQPYRWQDVFANPEARNEVLLNLQL